MSCPLCNDLGMVRTDDLESGGWEICPHCQPQEDQTMSFLNRVWMLFLAKFRLSESAVCKMSRGRGAHNDFHDYPDAGNPPWHFHTHKCLRCGKEFTI